MKIRKALLQTFFTSVMVLSVTPALAATQGTVGTTSTGTLVVQITIPSLVRISGLSDITIPAPSNFAVPATGSTTACIYSNQRAVPGGYAITATSANASGGLFFTKNTLTVDTLQYTAQWASNSAGTTPATLTSGTKLPSQLNASSTSISCAGGSNAFFGVSFAAAAIQLARDGTYQDTVTLLVSPT